ncbi:MAG: alanine racemase [Candidatus Peregrinibacteria bacterium]|nr:alanine racemase [Candidatus Peregrinibacteria bacterium]
MNNLSRGLNWVEISKEALSNNVKQFRRIIGDSVLLCPCVKANAYGHGLVECSKTFIEAGANWLAVNSLYEAEMLRHGEVTAPIYILGYVEMAELPRAVELECRLVAYNKEMIEALGAIGKPAKIHIKVETGNNRQGVLIKDLIEFVEFVKSFVNIEIEGLTTHFANVEDTTDHSYAELQLAKFNEGIKKLESIGVNVPIKHCANSAAAILFPKTHFQLVRVGIASYGMWPASYLSSAVAEPHASRSRRALADPTFILTPALTWKTKIAQIKTIPAGEYIGYGCTYKTGHETRLAILPVGYYDGYDRGINGGHVLIRGKRAPVRGRVCMNIIMVEVTDIPEAKLEDEVILIGRSGDEEISAEQFGKWAGTINYEVTTRINERVPRIFA